MYLTELEHIVGELREHVGTHRGQVWQPRRDHLVIEIGAERLAVITGSGRARIHFTRARPRQPKKPYSFQGACRARLGGMLTAVRVLAPNRAIELQFGSTTLHFRLFGRGLGVLLPTDGPPIPIAGMDGPSPDQLPPMGAPPGPPRQPRFTPEPGESFNQAADRFFRAQERARARRELNGQVRRRLTAETRRMARLVEALTGDLEASERAPALRATGDVLAAHLHRVRRGQQSVQLPTFEDPEVWCTIPLDPRLGPSENLNRIYQKARRLERSGERVLERLDATETRLAELRATLETLDEQDLDGLISLDKHLPKSGPTRRPSASDGWDTWTGPDGMRIRVGRNERANRRLCFSVSRGRDWWFHLRNAPGAHVVLRLHGQQSPPLSALLAASELVLMSAKLPEGASADVQYTQVRHLRPIPGEQGGRVRIASERVLRVERDPGQLDGWLREEPLS